MIPIATFLAGSILSLLLPVLLLIGLVIWYVRFVRSVPEPDDESHAGAPAPPPAGPGAPEPSAPSSRG
jgi:hypothetical protein